VRLWLSVFAYKLGNLWRAAGAVEEVRRLILDHRTSAVGENWWTFDQKFPSLLAGAGGESSDAAPLLKNATENTIDRRRFRI
jgi:hypothetical protein